MSNILGFTMEEKQVLGLVKKATVQEEEIREGLKINCTVSLWKMMNE
jgi:hypothetical protein